MSSQNHSPGIRDWIRLIRSDGVGPTIFHRLLRHFGSVERALQASVNELKKVEGIGSRTAEQILASRNRFDADKEIAHADKLGVWIINTEDQRYPPALGAIYDPPPVLYVKGSLSRSDSLAVAIVGSRRCSIYGREQASRLAHMLASAGFTIVSGMARGIDTAAHRGALSANGRTIAVQGCGLNNIFPPENEALYRLITSSGASISELPLGYEPLAENFPGRNRIIAGLSMAVIVIEASAKSGAMITARAALENNREVMAVPGKIDSPLSRGAHRLIKDGARLIEGIEDVMDTLGRIGQDLRDHAARAAHKASRDIDMPLFDTERLNLTETERAVLDSLDTEPAHVEEIIVRAQVSAGAANSALISLRLKGIVTQLPGNLFARKKLA